VARPGRCRPGIAGRAALSTLVLDTGNGAENFAADCVCFDKYGGDWTDFNAYGRGMEVTVPMWASFLALLDEVRVQRRMGVLIPHHAKVKEFSDPAGKTWQQWRPEQSPVNAAGRLAPPTPAPASPAILLVGLGAGCVSCRSRCDPAGG
jgi:hypothetical protein